MNKRVGTALCAFAHPSLATETGIACSGEPSALAACGTDIVMVHFIFHISRSGGKVTVGFRGGKKGYSMAEALSGAEIKPSFSRQYIGLTLVTAVMSGVLGFMSSYAVEFFKKGKDQKVISVAVDTSPNLASIPQNVSSYLQVLIGLGGGQKVAIKSLFRYQVSLTNRSEYGLDDFLVFFNVPNNITLIRTPTLQSTPESLINTITLDNSGSDDHKGVYKISLLNPQQSLSFSYFGYANEDITTPQMAVTVQKKDWIQFAGDTNKANPAAWEDKKLSDLTGRDISVTLPYFITFIFVLFIYVYLFVKMIDIFFSRVLGRWIGKF